MRFQLPKPLHGWREFVGEVGIIVLGVLIALGAQQLVEELSWRAQVREATETLRREVGDHYRAAAEVVIAAPCIDRQLQLLSAEIAAHPAKPVPLYSDEYERQFVIRAPSRAWSDNQWSAVRDEGVASHLGKDLRSDLGYHYAQVEIMRDNNRVTDQLQSRLTVLAQPMAFDPATRARLSEEVQELRGRFDLMRIVGNQIIGRIDGMGFKPAGRVLPANSGTLGFCAAHRFPIGKIEPETVR